MAHLPAKNNCNGFLLMWSNFKFEVDMPDCLCRPTGSTSFRGQVKGPHSLTSTGLICPKSGTVHYDSSLTSVIVLSKFMLSFIVVIVCDLCKWK
jgi:hypothetical protein